MTKVTEWKTQNPKLHRYLITGGCVFARESGLNRQSSIDLSSTNYLISVNFNHIWSYSMNSMVSLKFPVLNKTDNYFLP